MNQRILAAFVLLLPLAVLSCADSPVSAEGERVPTIVSLYPPELVLDDGTGGSILARVLDRDGRPLPASEARVEWSSSNPEVAAVDSTGGIRALHPGSATLTARSGSVEGRARVEVRPVPGTIVPEGSASPRVDTAAVVVPAAQGVVSARVLDRHGSPVADALVRFVPDEGSGTADPAEVRSDSSGYARTSWTRPASASAWQGSALARASVQWDSTAPVIVLRAYVEGVEAPLVFRSVPPGASRIVLGADSVLLEAIGEEVALSARPLDAIGAEVGGTLAWSTSDPEVVTVSSAGLLTARGDGSARVTASLGRAEAALRVWVAQKPASLSLTASPTQVSPGDTLVLSASALDGRGHPVEGAVPSVVSLNPDVVKVLSPTRAVAVGAGSAKLHAGLAELRSAPLEVRVDQQSVVGPSTAAQVRITSPSPTLALGDEMTLSATVYDRAGGTLSVVVQWSSMDESRITVDSTGTVRALQAGPARVVARSGSAADTVTLTLEQRVRRVEIGEAAVRVALGEQHALSAVAYDGADAALSAALTWTSLATGVVTVDSSGVLTTVGRGEARVVAAAEAFADTASVVVYPTVASVEVVPVERPLALGDQRTLEVQARDAVGEVVDTVFSWSSLSPAVASVSAAGVVTAVEEGTARIVASAGAAGASDTVEVAVVHPVRAIAVTPASITLQHGDSVQVTATALDAANQPMNGIEFTWSSADPAVATVTPGGRVAGVAPGSTTVTVGVGGVSQSIPVEVGAGSELVVDPLSGGALLPGQTVTLTGRNFGVTPAANTVTVAGMAATVLSASSTEIQIRLPERSALPCQPTQAMAIRVSAGGQTREIRHELTVGARRRLGAGESMLLSGAADLGCNELPQGGRYLVTVYSVSNSSGATRFSLAGNTMPAADAPHPSLDGIGPARSLTTRTAQPPEVDPHLEVLEESHRLSQTLGTPPPGVQQPEPAGAADPFRVSRSVSALRVGDVVTRNVPVGATGAFTSCSASGSTIDARVVYLSDKIVLLEDNAAPLAGQMDTALIRLGTEYDSRMHGVLTTHFGDPAAHGVDGDGRIQVVFTRLVNRYGVLGFVYGGDYYPSTSCEWSNQNETAYIRVPGSDYPIGSWRDAVWSTLIHEAKHLASYSERYARGYSLESSWLEESTAVASEEIWARAYYPGYGQNRNAELAPCDYSSAVSCTAPIGVSDGFYFLAQYLRSVETRSPLGSVYDGDYSFYGSGWWLVRYAADHSGLSEAAFFRGLIASPETGLTNLVGRAGRTAEELLGNWTLANYLDDRPGFSPSSPLLTHPSWHSEGSAGRVGGTILPRALGSSTSIDIGELRSATASYFETGVVGGTGQAIHLTGPAGTPIPSTLRVGIVRLE